MEWRALLSEMNLIGTAIGLIAGGVSGAFLFGRWLGRLDLKDLKEAGRNAQKELTPPAPSRASNEAAKNPPKANWSETRDIFQDSATTAVESEPHSLSWQHEWTEPQAFLAVLLAAAHADGVVTFEEQEQLKGLRRRARILKSLSIEQANKAANDALQKLQQEGDVGLREACERLPELMRMPVFALAIDLVLADGRLTISERDFISKIAGWLQIDKGIEWQISQVMLIKNNC